MSQQAREFLQHQARLGEAQHLSHHRVAGTMSGGGSKDSSLDELCLLENFRRPAELWSCKQQALSNGHTHGIKGADCACNFLPDPRVCKEGYESLTSKVSGGDVRDDPDSLVNWCRNPANVPTQYYDNKDQRHMFVLGCVSAIRGNKVPSHLPTP